MWKRITGTFTSPKGRNLSSLLAFISILVISELVNYPIQRSLSYVIMVFIVFSLAFVLFEKVFNTILKTRNKEISIIPYIVVAAILATINIL